MKNEMPNFPAVKFCHCYPTEPQCHCVCGDSEKALRAWSAGRLKTPMTKEQREWCLAEIDQIEGYNRKHYIASPDDQLARGVLTSWQDYCLDKGLI